MRHKISLLLLFPALMCSAATAGLPPQRHQAPTHTAPDPRQNLYESARAYETGNGVPQDYFQAARLYYTAA